VREETALITIQIALIQYFSSLEWK